MYVIVGCVWFFVEYCDLWCVGCGGFCCDVFEKFVVDYVVVDDDEFYDGGFFG